MNELNIPRAPAIAPFPKWGATVFKMVGVALLIVLPGCVKPGAQSQTGPRDHLVGWFNLSGCDEQNQVVSGHGTLIPVFKRDGTYYSVCRGGEVPLKECPEGLEWALTPSSMAGTKIGFGKSVV